MKNWGCATRVPAITLPPKYKNVLRVYKSVGRLEFSVSNIVSVLTVVLDVEARVIAAVLATE